MNADARRQATELLFKRAALGSEDFIRLGGELLELGATPEQIDALVAQREAERREALLYDLVAFVRRYVVLPEEAAVVVAVWIVHTHALEAFDVTPYLNITSPEKRSGKSRLLEVLKLLVPNPLHVILPSEAVLFRTINAGNVTLLLDEADAFFRRDANDAQEGVRAVLNAGFERGATVPRCLDRGRGVEKFSVFCAKAIAGIGAAPDTIVDRSFTIAMRRRKKSEKAARFRRREVAPEGELLRERCAAFATENLEALKRARPEIPEVLNDRAADAAEPLIAISDFFGGPWSARVRAALVALAGEKESEADTLGCRLLADVDRVLDLLRRPERVRTSELLRELHALEDAPWRRYGHRREPIEADELARLLKNFRIRPRAMRFGEKAGTRGYLASELRDAFDRYGPTTSEINSENEETHLSRPPQRGATPQQATIDAPRNVDAYPQHGPQRADELFGDVAAHVAPLGQRIQSTETISVETLRGVAAPSSDLDDATGRDLLFSIHESVGAIGKAAPPTESLATDDDELFALGGLS